MLADKYRPRVLSDVVGQPVIVQTLTNAWNAKKLHQVYLFSGFLGSGKTSCARIIAAMENCETSPGLNPCGKCNSCKMIHNSNHPDVQEIDAAGHFAKVEQVRNFKNEAFYNPITTAKKKIFIIDEVHNLSGASFDALLKLLEEPPSHVRFVLCTTDPQKVKPTVLSRCQRHDFKKIYWSQLAEQLNRICQLEKIKAEAIALNIVARFSGGSMRTAIQNLETLISFVGDGNSLTAEQAQKMFGTADEMSYFDIIDHIIGMSGGKPDASESFKIINKLLADGADFIQLYNGIAEHLRDIMVGYSSSNAWNFIELSDEGKKRLLAQIKVLKENKKFDAILESIRKLYEARRAVEYNISPEFALQHWVIESIFAFRKQ